jgi:putative peptidoglycan lipid II flippase
MVPLVRFWTPDLKETVRKWGPALMISGISLVNQQVSVTLAATLPEGSVSALTNAITFWQLPAGVLSASVITEYFPRMSRQVARKDWESASSTMVQGLELQALLLVPAGLLMALFSEPIVALAFQRGQFTYHDTVLAARVLSWLSWGLFFSGLLNFLQRFFYAKGDFKTPFWISLLWAGADVAVSVTLMHTSLGVVGLAAGSVAGFGIGAVVSLFVAWRSMPWRRLGVLCWFWVRIAVAMVPVGAGFLFLTAQTGRWWQNGLSLTSLGLLAAEGIGCVAVYGLGLLAVGIRPWRLWGGHGGKA